MSKAAKVTAMGPLDNDAKWRIEAGRPYRAVIQVVGTAPLIFHRWSGSDVGEKANGRKGSAVSKTDNVESYVYRNLSGGLCLPGEHFRQATINAAKFRTDPRSPRANATALFKAGLVSVDELCDLGVAAWDYLDTRRAIIQRNAINRVRPALHSGWKTTVLFDVLLAEYIDPSFLQDVITDAGRFVGVGDFRPTH